ncbi:MAG: ImmA/IrrE family metallo-endopeptidase [Opitutaceae bacterium]
MHPQTDRLATLCCDAADKAADGENFVSMKRLVEFFGVELRAQPLLYEGMVAEPRTKGDKWVVMVDSHSSGYDVRKYEQESSTNALPPRVRFTIAHELGHVLQLRNEEALGPTTRTTKRGAAAKVEKQLERGADSLSPLLLISENGIERLCEDAKSPLGIAQIIQARARWAVSREVIVHRFGLLSKYDPSGFKHRPALRDMALGLGEWSDTPTAARVSAWPRAFCNFAENLVPEFLRVDTTSKENLSTVFRSPAFVLNGGEQIWDEAEVFAGTASNPRAEKVRIRLAVEQSRSLKKKFLFVAERLPVANCASAIA